MVALMCACCCDNDKFFKISYKSVVKRPDVVSLRSAVYNRYFLDIGFDFLFFKPLDSSASFRSTSFVFDSGLGSFVDLDNEISFLISNYCINNFSLVGSKFNEASFISSFNSYLPDTHYSIVFEYCRTIINSLKPHYDRYASFLKGLENYPSLPPYDLQQFYSKVKDFLSSEPPILFEFVVSFDVKVSLDENNIIRSVKILSFDEISSQIN